MNRLSGSLDGTMNVFNVYSFSIHKVFRRETFPSPPAGGILFMKYEAQRKLIITAHVDRYSLILYLKIYTENYFINNLYII